jgi:Ca-activated chloride channel family protein
MTRHTTIRTALNAALCALALSGCDDAAMSDIGGGAVYSPPPPAADQANPGETYENPGTNPFVDPAEDPLATFAIDVDTASYTLMRSDIEAGHLPNQDGVRVEEYINYFDYRDRPSDDSSTPFAIHTELAPSPFGEGLHLLRVALKGYEVAAEERKPANLVFLIDVSGSMMSGEKIGLVREGLTRLTDTLHPDDTIGIVTYAGADTIALEPTPVRDRATIAEAIMALDAGGSTNGEAGIRTAYRLAEQALRPGGINRVLLCSDGDFNVGVTGDPLIALIDQFRERSISLSVFGFGRGNYNDAQMEQLADHGNGNYAFIDSVREVQRVMVDTLGSTLQTIAKDVKIQVEVDPALVARYRLIGYENRALADEDFRDDQVDAGEIGAGHTVTAFIELELKPEATDADEALALARVRVRHKHPDATAEDAATETARTVHLSDRLDLADASDAFRFGAAVAEFAEILRASPHSEGRAFEAVAALAQRAVFPGNPYMAEFIVLVQRAAAM